MLCLFPAFAALQSYSLGPISLGWFPTTVVVVVAVVVRFNRGVLMLRFWCFFCAFVCFLLLRLFRVIAWGGYRWTLVDSGGGGGAI